ncbi:MAG: alpha/beta hydrolase, partial [Candidatus Hermodarchaeia archaeon]
MTISSVLQPRQSFDKIYARVPPRKTAALKAFRATCLPNILEVDGVGWEYLNMGEGKAILFLHGMGGAYDIWFQQFEALKGEYQLIAATYPGIGSLAQMETGLLAVLDEVGVSQFNILGTSLGGYIAQYLVARHPERIIKAIFANTFPPNNLIIKQYGALGRVLPVLPGWLIKWVMRGRYKSSIYPASGYDELTLAYLNETLERFTKAEIIGRYRCVVEAFDPPDLSRGKIPVMIVEASNDPLLAVELR